ncbi:MAG: c-type cytochrome [Verrucomicrobiota bacterium]
MTCRPRFQRTFLTFLAGWSVAIIGIGAPISSVIQQIDPRTGKAKETTTTHEIRGIVSARATLPSGEVLAFLQPAGEAGLPVLFPKADGPRVVVRNELSLSGPLAEGPFSFAVLKAKAGTTTIEATNKAFGAAEPRGAAFFKDASSLSGRYVQLANVTFPPGRFDDSGWVKVQGSDGTVTLRIPVSIKDRETPLGLMNVFGVPLKVDGEWQLMASRFLSVSNKASLALAGKHTCTSCHSPDIKAVGPAYRDVAAKYKDDPGARAALITQIQKGGSGKWGPVLMPPLGSKVPPADREVLIDWVLGYRWDALLSE